MAEGADENAKEVAESIRAQLKEVTQNLRLQMNGALDLLRAEIIQNLRGASGLSRRTGALMNSVKKKIEKEGEALVGTVGPRGVPYARIHEFGGTVKPVNAKNLVFPVEENRKRDGSPKVTLDEVFKNKTHFFHDGILWIQKFKQGRKGKRGMLGKLGIRTRGEKKNTGVTPMFYFKKSVKIPARPYMQPALAAKKDQILKDFGIFLSMSFKPKG